MTAKSLWESFSYAFQGLVYSFKTQRNFRIHCLASAAIGLLSVFLDFDLSESVAILSAVFLVLISELFNTAVEKTIDLYTDKYHSLAKIAKNCAAAAVLLSALYAIAAGAIVLLPRILKYIRR